jgi:hypothetical protein
MSKTTLIVVTSGNRALQRSKSIWMRVWWMMGKEGREYNVCAFIVDWTDHHDINKKKTIIYLVFFWLYSWYIVGKNQKAFTIHIFGNRCLMNSLNLFEIKANI